MKKFLALLLALILFAATSAQASDAMGQTLLVDDAQTHNALLAASAISGTRLDFGESFSFNAAVGPRTAERGYVTALNGRGAEVVGGGCAQAASALYLALCNLAPGAVSFDELSFYGDRYSGAYVSGGGEAVLVDYSGGRDFRFTNLAPGAMTIAFGQLGDCLLCTVTLDDAPSMADSASFRAAAPMPVGPGSVTLDCGSDPAVLSNVAIAAASVHDTVLSSGDLFSFNDIVGPRDAVFGYVPAVNGRGAEVVGGGCAQVASALWLLIQDNPDFVIVEKSTYGSKYNQSYVSRSADAILADYAAGTDFVFRYVGPGAITLYATLSNSTLTMGLFS